MPAPVAHRVIEPSTQTLIAADRQRFLGREPLLSTSVRPQILSSWRRSREARVEPDRVEPVRADDVDIDTPLSRAARPVIRTLVDQLDGQAMSVVVADLHGMVLTRQSGDPGFDRHLDAQKIAPGFLFGEDRVGTNGIGMALEVGGPASVVGHEHFADGLDALACAGVPVSDPVSGRTLGVLDLTCWARDAGPLLLALARTTAHQIKQSFLEEVSSSQRELLQEYLRTCRRLPGIVIALSEDTTILNDHARRVLAPDDQAALIELARESLTHTWRGAVAFELPSGRRATLYSRVAHPGSPVPGVVVHVRLSTRSSTTTAPAAPAMTLPGLIGSEQLWVHSCRRIEEASTAGQWVALSGEPGVGKRAVLQAVQLRHQPVRELTFLEARAMSAPAQWTTPFTAARNRPGHGIVLLHADELDPQLASRVARDLAAAQGEPPGLVPWVALTLGPVRDETPRSSLLDHVPTTVEVPPLRLRPQDLEPLIRFFLRRLDPKSQLRLPPDVMSALSRYSWPGNTQEVLTVLRDIVRHRRTGTVTVDDLPPATRTIGRRRLTQMEAVERDAVVQALDSVRGDKAAAARSLGISRATIYRKIHDYGIFGA